jgi:hypothetical protein
MAFMLKVGMLEKAQKNNLIKHEKVRLLGCGAVWVYYEWMFRRNVSPPSSGQKK